MKHMFVYRLKIHLHSTSLVLWDMEYSQFCISFNHITYHYDPSNYVRPFVWKWKAIHPTAW